MDKLSSSARKCINVSNWLSRGCLGYEGRRVATKNLELTTKVIYLCISLPFLVDKLQQIARMEKFFFPMLLRLLARTMYTHQTGVTINCMPKVDIRER